MIYLPFLEETGYIPKDRFSSGREIREHLSRIVEKWDLSPKAQLQTEITSVLWDESILRWHIYTDRSDHFISQFVILATGTLHEPKLPGFPGIENFKGDHFHSGRWNYDVSGGDATGELKNLSDKTVGVIGTGASGIQLTPKLAQYAKKLYVFQRTPSSVSIRENPSIDPAISASLEPGWQTARMKDFADILQGDVLDKECTALEGLEPLTMKAIFQEAKKSGLQPQQSEIPELIQLADFRLMESIRKLVEDTVKDQETAEKLKPWYGFMCKRPAFNNDYLSTFNKNNVELVDTDGKGVSHITEAGVVANDKEYDVDVLIYSTGFNFEVESDFHQRTGIKIIGTKGRTVDELWHQKGPSTLFGLHIPEFPNLFIIGPSQAGVTANWTHTAYVAGDHIAEVVGTCLRDGSYQAFEPTEEGAEGWGKQIEEGSEMRLQFAKSCPPGYFNREGKPEEIHARWGFYPKGITAWANAMREWREEGSMKWMDKR